MKPYLQEIIAGVILLMILAVVSLNGLNTEQNVQEIIASIILLVTLVVFTLGKSPVFRVDRAGMSIIGASLMIGFGILTIEEAMQAIDAGTIIVLFSLMVVVSNLKLAGFFSYIGKLVFAHIHTGKTLLLTVIFMSGILSSIVINDIVCLLFTPVVIMICLNVKVNPVPYLLAIAMASNLGSACTFIGNPQNILIGNLSKISAGEYFMNTAILSFLGLLMLYMAIMFIYKRDLNVDFAYKAKYNKMIHKYLLAKTLLVLALIISFYLWGIDLSLTASLGAAFLLISTRIKPNRVYEDIDFNLLIMFIGLFIIMSGVEKSGLLNLINGYLSIEYMKEIPLFAVMSIILSNIVSNVPAVLLLKYYILPDEQILWQVLALFSTIAGNLTVFGSIANLIVLEVAKKQGIEISSKEYFKIGFPLTIILAIISVMWFSFLH